MGPRSIAKFGDPLPRILRVAMVLALFTAHCARPPDSPPAATPAPSAVPAPPTARSPESSRADATPGPDLPVIDCESWFGGFAGTRPHPLAPSVLHEVIRAQLTAQRVGGRRGHLTFPAHPIDVDILVVAGSAAVERDGVVHRVTAWQAVRLADAEGVVRGDPDACLVVGLSTDAPSLEKALLETSSGVGRAPVHLVDLARVSAVEGDDGMRVRSVFRGGRGSFSILSGAPAQERAERVCGTDEALLTLTGMKWLWVMPNRGDALDMPWLGAGRMLEPSLYGEIVPAGHHHAITRFHGTGGEVSWTAVQLLAPG